jgi:phosphoesterase RecJ-like protein
MLEFDHWLFILFMVEKNISLEVFRKIGEANKVLLLGHSNPRPDGDSLGAVLTLVDILKRIKKDFTAFTLYPAEESLQYLPGLNWIEHNPEKIKIKDYDLILMLDFGELKNSGLEEKLKLAKAAGTFFIHLDHHPLREKVGEITLVDDRASSTCEVLYNVIVGAGLKINANMATCLLTGILTDTQNYTNLATTFTSLQVGADLLRLGARLQEITTNTWRNRKIPTLRLWGKILLRLEEDPKTGIATTAVTLQDLKEESLTLEAVDQVANFLNSLGQAKAILVLKEEEGGKVKGSLRTTRDDIDVSQFARQFGGGGHKKAAGFSVPGHLVKTDKGWKIVPSP